VWRQLAGHQFTPCIAAVDQPFLNRGGQTAPRTAAREGPHRGLMLAGPIAAFAPSWIIWPLDGVCPDSASPTGQTAASNFSPRPHLAAVREPLFGDSLIRPDHHLGGNAWRGSVPGSHRVLSPPMRCVPADDRTYRSRVCSEHVAHVEGAGHEFGGGINERKHASGQAWPRHGKCLGDPPWDRSAARSAGARKCSISIAMCPIADVLDSWILDVWLGGAPGARGVGGGSRNMSKYVELVMKLCRTGRIVMDFILRNIPFAGSIG